MDKGLKEPVSRLQNALSFNFFGNTEIYDERSVSTISDPDPPKVGKDPATETANNSNTMSTNNTSANNLGNGDPTGTVGPVNSTGPDGNTEIIVPGATNPPWAYNVDANSYVYSPNTINTIPGLTNNIAGPTSNIDANTTTSIIIPENITP